jgi:hypothetical protein
MLWISHEVYTSIMNEAFGEVYYGRITYATLLTETICSSG